MKEGLFKKIIRVILGIVLVIFGLNGFLQFMPAPQFNAAGTAFLSALFASGFVFPIINLAFLLVGVLFIIGKAKPFATLLLLPFTSSILLFHLVLDFSQSAIGIVLFVINIWFVFSYKKAYRSLFS